MEDCVGDGIHDTAILGLTLIYMVMILVEGIVFLHMSMDPTLLTHTLTKEEKTLLTSIYKVVSIILAGIAKSEKSKSHDNCF